MAYDSDGLARSVVMLLRATPQLSLHEIAIRQGIERHTLNRALKRVLGKSFRTLKREQQTRRLTEIARQTTTAAVLR